MKSLKFYLIIGLLSVMQQVSASSSYLRIVDYDDIRKEGGFRSQTLQNVTQIMPSGNILTNEEKDDLATNNNLLNLKTISFENQAIDDDFIINLCTNESLKRIINLNLSKNVGITNQSIEEILDSDILGSVRDLPQISGRFGIPGSVIYIQAEETSVVPPNVGYRYFDKHRFEFSISYHNPITGTETCKTAENGVKFVEVTLN